MHRATAATKVAVTPVPNVMVYTAGKKMPLAVEGSGDFSWLLTTEEGVHTQGYATGGKAFTLSGKAAGGVSHADPDSGRTAHALPDHRGAETLLMSRRRC